MRRLVSWSLVVLTLSIVALVGVGFMSAWNDRAEDICRKEAPRTTSGYSSTWEWAEFAYVCDYGAPSEDPKRVGITDAFHQGGRERHRLDR
jgi:hypothetical protein